MRDADTRGELPVAHAGVKGEVAYDRAGTVGRGKVQRLLAAQWPISRLAVLGLQSISAARKLVQGKPESACDPVGDVPCGIGDAALDPADGGSVEIGGVG